jgi:acetamidase/formamidase
MALHIIESTEDTVHTFFSNELAPILTINSGDTVRYRTLDAGGGLEPPPPAGSRQKLKPRREGLSDGHALCGPIAIREAEPGMTLAVQIDSVRPGAWGWTSAGGELTNEQKILHVWTLSAATMQGRNQHGHTLALRPFMGVLGMPPAEPGQHSTIPPRNCGGNIDCKELGPGSTLYLPIPVPGALFSIGDGHAVQADGELGGTAIECPMEEVLLTFHLLKDMRLTTPRATTPAGWLTFGFDKDLGRACRIALDAMLDFMVEQLHLNRGDAVALASLVVDLRITQIVNDLCGVHAVLPHQAIQLS